MWGTLASTLKNVASAARGTNDDLCVFGCGRNTEGELAGGSLLRGNQTGPLRALPWARARESEPDAAETETSADADDSGDGDGGGNGNGNGNGDGGSDLLDEAVPERFLVDALGVPVATSLSLRAIRTVSCGQRHTVVVTVDHLLFTSGFNGDGQLGLGHGREAHTLQLVRFFTAAAPGKGGGDGGGGRRPIRAVAAGARHTLVAVAAAFPLPSAAIGSGTDADLGADADADAAARAAPPPHASTDALFAFGSNAHGELGIEHEGRGSASESESSPACSSLPTSGALEAGPSNRTGALSDPSTC